MSEIAPRPAVFLDRDGVLTREEPWVLEPADVVLLPGAAAGVRRLNEAGIPVLVVTNQSAVARGWIDETRLAAIHARLIEELRAHGARLDAIRHCPHHPTEGVGALRVTCRCRKPAPGMLVDLAALHGVDLARSWLVGDAARDVEAARAAGVRTALVRTGKGSAELPRIVPAPDLVCDRLDEAVEEILVRLRAAQGK